MDKPDAQTKREAVLDQVRSMLDEATAADTPTPNPAPAIPWCEHGAFCEIDGARWQIVRARDALAGIAAMLQPETDAYDEQMNMTRRSDAAAVFAFFAEAMCEPLAVIDEAASRLQTDLRAGQP